MIKKSYLYSIGIFFLGSLVTGNILAQENEKKVHLKVVKNGRTTIDTSFVAGNMEKAEIHEIISELADVDVFIENDKDLHEMHSEHYGEKHKIVVVQSGDREENEGGKSEKYVYSYTSDDDSSLTMNSDTMLIIDADTIIMKKNGNVFVMKGDADEGFEWVEKESGEENDAHFVKSDENEIIIMSSDEEGSSHVKITKIENGDTVANTAIVKYISDNESDNLEQESNNVKIVVVDKNNGTGFVSKKVKVVKSEGDNEGDIEITVTIEDGNSVKMEKATKKSSKKTKQKKEEKRKSK